MLSAINPTTGSLIELVAGLLATIVLIFLIDYKVRVFRDKRRAEATEYIRAILLMACNSKAPSDIVSWCEDNLPRKFGVEQLENQIVKLRCEHLRLDIELVYRVHLNILGNISGVDYQISSVDINNRLRKHATVIIDTPLKVIGDNI